MLVKAIIQEIKQLPVNQRFMVVEQTLKSIQKEEAKNSIRKIEKKNIEQQTNLLSIIVNSDSLSKEWLSDEDKRWDSLL